MFCRYSPMTVARTPRRSCCQWSAPRMTDRIGFGPTALPIPAWGAAPASAFRFIPPDSTARVLRVELGFTRPSWLTAREPASLPVRVPAVKAAHSPSSGRSLAVTLLEFCCGWLHSLRLLLCKQQVNAHAGHTGFRTVKRVRDPPLEYALGGLLLRHLRPPRGRRSGVFAFQPVPLWLADGPRGRNHRRRRRPLAQGCSRAVAAEVRCRSSPTESAPCGTTHTCRSGLGAAFVIGDQSRVFPRPASRSRP